MMNFSKANIQPDDITKFLKKELQFKEICQKILDQQIIDRAARERGVAVTGEEIQAEADRFRMQNRLEKASDTLAWLEDRMTSPEEWEAGIRDRLLAKKLANALFGKEAEKLFAQNKVDYEQVLLYQIVVSDEKLARELFYQIEDREISFYQAAHLYDIDERRRLRCGFEGKLDRWHLKPDIAATVFAGSVGEVLGPLPAESGYSLLMVEEFIPAELTPQRYQEIVSKMFKEWLENELTYYLHELA